MRARRFQARFLVVGFVCVVSGSIVPGCSETDGGSGALVGAQGEGDPAGDAASLLDPEQMERVEIVSALEGRAIECLASAFGEDLNPGTRTELARAFGRAMDLYVFGNAEDFLASLEAEQSISEQDASQFRSQWERASEVIGRAPMDGAGVMAHLAVAGGERLESKPRLGTTVVEGTRRGAGTRARDEIASSTCTRWRPCCSRRARPAASSRRVPASRCGPPTSPRLSSYGTLT